MSSKRVPWGRYLVKGAYYFKDSFGYIRMGNVFRSGEDNTLILVRQPDNRYDSNAIQVHTPSTDTQVGWIAKELNRELALVMDNFDVTVFGVLRQDSDFANHKLQMDVFVQQNDDAMQKLMAENAKLMAKLKVAGTPANTATEILAELKQKIGTVYAGHGLTPSDAVMSVTPKPVASDFL
jgi:hypothetical protein